ncbi:hypothetical protein [Kordiimonas sp.]
MNRELIDPNDGMAVMLSSDVCSFKPEDDGPDLETQCKPEDDGLVLSL